MKLSFRLRKLLNKTNLKMNRTSGYIKSADLVMFDSQEQSLDYEKSIPFSFCHPEF